MNTNFVLVDFENVQPNNMGLLKGGAFKIKVFLGASQGKISLEMAQALQTFGDDAEYIQVVGSGKDALDFHIAYYIGRLSAENPGAAFSIISKDTGFDPLVKHLKARGIDCKRSASVADIPHIKSASLSPAKQLQRNVAAKKATAPKLPAQARARTSAVPRAKQVAPVSVSPPVRPAQLDVVLENLVKRKRALPGTIKTLRSTIQSLFKPALEEAQLDAIMTELAKSKHIKLTGSKVSYALS